MSKRGRGESGAVKVSTRNWARASVLLNQIDSPSDMSHHFYSKTRHYKKNKIFLKFSSTVRVARNTEACVGGKKFLLRH